MENNAEKDKKESNKKRMLLALCLLSGDYPENYVIDFDTLKKEHPELVKEAEKTYEEANKTKDVNGQTLSDKIETPSRVDEKTVFTEAAKIGNKKGYNYFKVLGSRDDKTCPNCEKWIDKIICMNGSDPRYPSYQQMMDSHVFHPNCRCSLHPVDDEIKPFTQTDIENQAMNTENIQDEILFTGFTDRFFETPKFSDETQEDKLRTYDYGSTLVQVSPFGTFQGWNQQSQSAIDEIVDEQGCLNIVNELNLNPREVLVDIDHGSCKPPEERNTVAAAWAWDFKVVNNVGNLNGLYCRLKWTTKGRELVETRQYRFLSPVWSLDGENRVEKIISIALTNRPAISSRPILNTIPQKDDLDMTIDEIKEAVRAVVKEELAVQNQCAEKPEEKPVEQPEQPAEKPAETKVENTPPPEEADITKEKEETKEVDLAPTEASNVVEPPKEVEKPVEKEEVIKKEALNTKPDARTFKSKKDELLNLHGDAYIDFVRKNKKELMEQW